MNINFKTFNKKSPIFILFKPQLFADYRINNQAFFNLYSMTATAILRQ